MALGLTNLDIAPVRGNAALLPNQPIIQGAKVSASETATLVPGDVVTLATGGSADAIIVKKAAVTDLPVGVVARHFSKREIICWLMGTVRILPPLPLMVMACSRMACRAMAVSMRIHSWIRKPA